MKKYYKCSFNHKSPNFFSSFQPRRPHSWNNDRRKPWESPQQQPAKRAHLDHKEYPPLGSPHTKENRGYVILSTNGPSEVVMYGLELAQYIQNLRKHKGNSNIM